MASVVHISEQEAARDFAAVMRRVRAGEEVVVDCADGVEAVVKVKSQAASDLSAAQPEPPQARSLTAIIDGLKQRKARQGLAILDPDFAPDVEEARQRYNAPLDTSAWD